MRLAARTLLGTSVYAMIVLFAARLPTAAGLMLTFPALNGLAFYFSPRRSVEPMAATMLWMPLINGLLCAAYILLFLALGGPAPEALAVSLTIAVTIAWLAAVRQHRVRLGIVPQYQLGYAAFVTLAGLVLVALAVNVSHAPAPPPATAGGVFDVLRTSAWKIALFAAILLGFLVLSNSPAVPDHVRGILAGLPLIPFGGLLGIAADGSMDIETRHAIFAAMATTVWLSPAFAIWFIWAVSQAYLRLGDRDNGPRPAIRSLTLALAWLFCFAAVIAASTAVVRP